MFMSEVKGNRPVHLLQRERREVLADGFRRVAGLETVDDGVQGNTRADDVESAVGLFNVFAGRRAFSIKSCNQEVCCLGGTRDRSYGAECRIKHIQPEPEFRNQQVAGSIPAGGSKIPLNLPGRVPPAR